MGDPGHDYPWNWSINRWLDGEDAAAHAVDDLVLFARDLAGFLKSMQVVDTRGGPIPSADNFFRGGHLSVYDAEVTNCIDRLGKTIDGGAATELWGRAVSSAWDRAPVWVHGDIAAANLLVNSRRLCGVIDFGQLAVGDPACDVTIAWTFLHGKSRRAFRDQLDLGDATWIRGRGWALWKALVTLDGHRASHSKIRVSAKRVIGEILAEDD
jgi:aminoglycoside phosphotransferase (APT) family kinase protein